MNPNTAVLNPAISYLQNPIRSFLAGYLSASGKLTQPQRLGGNHVGVYKVVCIGQQPLCKDGATGYSEQSLLVGACVSSGFT